MARGFLHSLHEQLSTDNSASVLGVVLLVSVLVAVMRLAYQALTTHDDVAKLPMINGRKAWAFSATAQKLNFIQNARSLIQEGLDTTEGAFQLQTDDGIQLILSGEYADQIKDHPDLSLRKLTASDFQAGTPGFDAFTQAAASDDIFSKTLDILNRQIPKLVGALSEEAADSLQTHWTDNSEWHETMLFNTVMLMQMQISSSAFVGPELCRNMAWAECSKAYGAASVRAAQDLRLWSRWLRPLVHWFVPSCRHIRGVMAECRAIVTPIVEARRREGQSRMRQGQKPKTYNDAIEWLDQVADGRPYDTAAAVLMLFITASYTSASALTQVIYDICDKPQLMEDMRKEIVSVLSHGDNTDPEKQWSKSNMYQLKLMDSVMKESQRIRPPAITSMHRIVTKNTVLPNGLRMPKGKKLMVSAHQSWEDSTFPGAHKFDGYRFLHLRDEGLSTAQFVSTSASTMGFGHGPHACPGRFFAASEIKVALCHILLKYDLGMATENRPEMTKFALLHISDTTNCVKIRRRREEVQLL